MGLRCTHERTRLGQVIARNGIVHVEEQCLDCGANVRGPGHWVPHGEITRPVAELPILRDLRTPEDKGTQPTLF
jgi:hypothetical protein